MMMDISLKEKVIIAQGNVMVKLTAVWANVRKVREIVTTMKTVIQDLNASMIGTIGT